jgi:hypothetical protein
MKTVLDTLDTVLDTCAHLKGSLTINSKYEKQAGLSRATLEISSKFSSKCPLKNHTSQKFQKSFWGPLPLEVVFIEIFFIL